MLGPIEKIKAAANVHDSVENVKTVLREVKKKPEFGKSDPCQQFVDQAFGRLSGKDPYAKYFKNATNPFREDPNETVKPKKDEGDKEADEKKEEKEAAKVKEEDEKSKKKPEPKKPDGLQPVKTPAEKKKEENEKKKEGGEKKESVGAAQIGSYASEDAKPKADADKDKKHADKDKDKDKEDHLPKLVDGKLPGLPGLKKNLGADARAKKAIKDATPECKKKTQELKIPKDYHVVLNSK